MNSLRCSLARFAQATAELRADFPRPLLAPAPTPASEHIPWRWYAGLLVLCCIPRLVMAWKIDALCPDAMVYIDLAQAIERGDWGSGLAQMRLNVFPLALAALHRLGLDWMTAGELWNVCLSSAAVIPLMSWVRQMFDRRTALIAAFLYSVHPALIERSPELIRDPTFWFAMLWALDASWRAVVQVRLRDFVVAGLAILLAALTRFEGLLLFLPLLLWTAMRFFALRSPRWRLLVGLATAVGMLPFAVLVTQQIWMPSESPLKLIRIEPLARVQIFSRTLNTSPENLTATANAPSRESLAKSISKYATASLRGVSPLSLILIASGVLGWFQLTGRREHWPILLLIALVLAGSWFHLRYSGAMSCRYVLPAFLLALPWAALGLTWPASQLRHLPSAFQAPRFRAIAVSTVLAICLCWGWGDALSTRLQGRREIMTISQQIAGTLGPQGVIFTQTEASSQVAFYSGMTCSIIYDAHEFASQVERLDASQQVVVVLDRSKPVFRETYQLAQERLGLTRIYLSQAEDHSQSNWLVLGRSDDTRAPMGRTARRP